MSKFPSSRESLSSSRSTASGPVYGLLGCAIPSPLPKSSWSQGLVELLPNRVGQSRISSLSCMPSASSSSSISSRMPSLSWSHGEISGLTPEFSWVLVRPSPSQSSSAQLSTPSLSWSHVDCSSPQKHCNSWSTSRVPSLSSSESSPSGTPSLSLSTS